MPTTARVKSIDWDDRSLPNPMKARMPTFLPPLVSCGPEKVMPDKPAGIKGLPKL